MILILSNKWDVTVDFVVRELRQRNHPFLRINAEDLPKENCTISLHPFSIRITKQRREYDLALDVGVIWNRRPGKAYDDVPRSERPSEALKTYVENQWYSWLEALQLLEEVLWINHPRLNGQMENKARQLLVAQKIGFHIPDTLISNDPDPIMTLHRKYDNKLVVKALYSPLIEDVEQDYFIFSNVIESWPGQCDPELRVSPAIYQEPLFPKVDYRVTVVGDTVLAAKIYSSSDEFFADWRTQKDGLTFERVVLPKDIERMCRQYVKESGLVFGAIDLVEFKGRYYFLEINPNGEWGWLQKPHGLPIADVLCSFMTKFDLLNKG